MSNLKALAFVGTDNKQHLEQGEFRVMVGDQSTSLQVNEIMVY